MKKLIPIFILAALTMCVSCKNNNQKPSPRATVWGDQQTSVGKLSSNNVLVPFKRTSSGLAEVQVSLNGVPFNMYWDTGASITSISALDLANLIKQDKFQVDDKIGEVVVSMADGSTSEEIVVNIKEIYIQGKDNQYLILNDVAAVVSANAEAPLLIGQNVIGNLPAHSFNESRGVIEFDK